MMRFNDGVFFVGVVVCAVFNSCVYSHEGIRIDTGSMYDNNQNNKQKLVDKKNYLIKLEELACKYHSDIEEENEYFKKEARANELKACAILTGAGSVLVKLKPVFRLLGFTITGALLYPLYAPVKGWSENHFQKISDLEESLHVYETNILQTKTHISELEKIGEKETQAGNQFDCIVPLVIESDISMKEDETVIDELLHD